MSVSDEARWARIKPRLLLKGLVLIASFAVAGYLVKASGLHGILDEAWIDSNIKGQGLSGEFLFVAVAAGAVAVGVPRQLVSFLGGYAFDLLLGTGLALTATLLGCIGDFFYARFFGRNFVQTRFARRIKRVDDFLHDNPFSMTLLIRFLPVGSNLVTNLVAGVSSVRPLPFFLGSLLGYVPQTLVFALLGTGIQVDQGYRVTLSVALFVVSAVLGVYLYRRFRHGKKLDEELEAQLDEDGKEPGGAQ